MELADLHSVEEQLNTLIERRGTAWDRANVESYAEKEKQRQRQERIRRENAIAWADYFKRQAECHAILAAENERKARSVMKVGC